MKSIRQFLRAALMSESELATLQESHKKPLNITKDTTMELMRFGPSLSDMSSKVLLSDLPEVKRIVAETAIQGLFTKNYFDICAVRAIMEVVGGSKDSMAYKQLHALHCIDYANMPAHLRDILPRLLNECFRGESVASKSAITALEGII